MLRTCMHFLLDALKIVCPDPNGSRHIQHWRPLTPTWVSTLHVKRGAN